MESHHQYCRRDVRPGLWDKALLQWQASRGELTDQAPQPAQAQQPEAALSAGRRRALGPGIPACSQGCRSTGPMRRTGIMSSEVETMEGDVAVGHTASETHVSSDACDGGGKPGGQTSTQHQAP
jgi:hypothetical protein